MCLFIYLIIYLFFPSLIISFFISVKQLTVYSNVCLLYIQFFDPCTFLFYGFSFTVISLYSSVMTVNFSLKFIAEFYCICTPLFMLYTVTDIDLQNDSYFPKGGFCNGV